MNSTPFPSNSSAVSTDDKTTAIVSYLTIIGFVAAVVLHSSKKTSLATFHLRQSLGLMAASAAMIFVGMMLAFIPVLGWMADFALWLGIMALWFMGLLSAIKGESKPLPIVGEHFQKWFAGMFA
ncbi:MAG: hypothetical protein ABIZ04_04735 [Opitutus sp.]